MRANGREPLSGQLQYLHFRLGFFNFVECMSYRSWYNMEFLRKGKAQYR